MILLLMSAEEPRTLYHNNVSNQDMSPDRLAGLGLSAVRDKVFCCSGLIISLKAVQRRQEMYLPIILERQF